MLGEENSDLGEEGVLTAGQPPREVEEETGDQPNEDWMRLRDENQRSLVDMLSELIQEMGAVNNRMIRIEMRQGVADSEHLRVKRGRKQGTPKIKWWELKNERLKQQFKERVLNEITPKENANEWWEENSNIIRRVGEELLGKTSGRGAPQDKESWWWNREVQEKIRLKKEAKKKWDLSGRDDDKVAAKAAKKEAKKAVAQAKARRKMRTLTTKMIKGP
ncbi:hypothetical protein Pcinc_011284 [Petrolisthes cinctipes]|uniref:Uncharacterized protein n=1 Tax=Petrolisthes cinctipes TaxID=88211 RepID=A0AAE1G360_PETCI|nr:hypothetical protein Pcinc_011284 [Petrolisthes cinctipes]